MTEDYVPLGTVLCTVLWKLENLNNSGSDDRTMYAARILVASQGLGTVLVHSAIKHCTEI